MRTALGFAWRHKQAALWGAVVCAAAVAGFDYALGLEEGRIRHIKKMASEAVAMPGRLLT
jgi:hypothetical protein